MPFSGRFTIGTLDAMIHCHATIVSVKRLGGKYNEIKTHEFIISAVAGVREQQRIAQRRIGAKR
jgi:hypothetical protein